MHEQLDRIAKNIDGTKADMSEAVAESATMNGALKDLRHTMREITALAQGMQQNIISQVTGGMAEETSAMANEIRNGDAPELDRGELPVEDINNEDDFVL